jgi:hypothetical protein
VNNPRTLKTRTNQAIERELRRCADSMGPSEWEKHQQWVTQHVVASAKEWLAQQASRGTL